MLITTDGVVLRERTQGEMDKFIDVLTDDSGIISICVKGGRKLSSKNSGATQLFSYSKFCFNQKGDRNTLNSSEIISSFFNISSDIESLALASYFSELLRYSSLENIPSKNVKRLLLNCLYYLDNKERSPEFLKALFEFRLPCEIGLIPDLIGCCECYKFQSDSMYFDILNGKLYCSECFDKELDYYTVHLTDSELHTLRHIALTDFDRLFNFKITDELQRSVGNITEKYALAHFNRDFKTLKYYKSIKT
ncbi:MAG: DNA repair protein RecO [Ruminococcus sp.]|nr:DNA repair protein RecO [Ruminococcus sp.]